MKRSLFVATAASVALAAGATAGTSNVEVIYSRAPGSPTANVPGARDLAGNPVVTQFNSMLEFWLSPTGESWLLRGATTQGSDEANYLLLGSGSTGSLVLQEGQTFPGAVGSELIDFFSSSVGNPFDSDGDWAFSIRARGGTTAVANKILRYTGGVGVLRFQQGDLYTGVQDIPANPSGDEIIGNSTLSIHLLDDGRIGWQDGTVGNISTTRRPLTAYDAVKHLQARLDSVTTIDGGGSILVTNIASTGSISVFLTSPDGSRTVVRGDVDADGNGTNIPADPEAVIVDGQVRIQEGLAIPSTSVVVAAINQTFVAANNDWYARGTTASGAWAVRNGMVIAQTGDAVGTDTWGTGTFYTISGNTNGDVLLAGKTSNPNTAIDDVIAVNGQVVLREGDPVSVDLDGNGTPDTAYIGRANVTLAAFVANNSAGIAPDGTVYALVHLRSAPDGGSDLSPAGVPYALVRITPGGSACPADFNDSGDVTVQDIFDFLAAYFSGDPSGDFNGVGGVTVQDIFDFLAAYFSGC